MQTLKHRLRDAALPFAARIARGRSGDGDGAGAILVLQPDHLGDILLSQPAVRHLRTAFPDRRLIAIVGPWSRRIAELAWPVDEVRTLEYPGFSRDVGTRVSTPYRQLRVEARNLSALEASAAVVLRPDAWWAAWLAHASGVPHIVTSGDSRVAPFASRRASIPDDSHAAIRAHAIASALSGAGSDVMPSPQRDPLELPLLDGAASSVSARLVAAGVGAGRGYVVIHPGAGARIKQWPPRRWACVARHLLELSIDVVVTGSPDDRDIAESITQLVPNATNFVGRTNLDELIELIRGAALVVGPDCGPLHLAVATRTPTVHVFGPSDPRRYGPWGPSYQHVVVRAGWSCPSCGDLSTNREDACGCMLAVQTASVVTAVAAQLGLHAAA